VNELKQKIFKKLAEKHLPQGHRFSLEDKEVTRERTEGRILLDGKSCHLLYWHINVDMEGFYFSFAERMVFLIQESLDNGDIVL
jgi:lysophospholipid acyltransferase (LPLAT)-like uncharacterized protein